MALSAERPGGARAAARPRRARRPRRRRRAARARRRSQRDAVTSPPARPGANAGREILHAAALRADAGQQEDASRHQLAQRAPGARARSRRRRRRRRSGPPRRRRARRGRRRSARRRSHTRPAGGELEVLDVGRAGVRRAHEHEHAGAARRAPRRRTARARRRPCSGLTVSASAPRPRDLARTASATAERAPARRRVARDVDVAALAVGDHEQARRRGRARRPRASAAQPGAPRRSKHASCGLTATHAGAAASITARQCASDRAPPAARRRAAGRPRVARRRPATARAGSGSSPSTICDSRARRRARPGGRRRWSGERARRWLSAPVQPLTAFFSPQPAVKRGTLRGRDLDALAGARVARPRARRARRHGTCRSPRTSTSLPRAARPRRSPARRRPRAPASCLVSSARSRDLVDELGLRHVIRSPP